MTERIIIAGAGGQGIMLLGHILASAAMRENKYVTYLPAYGAEVRGGTAHSSVIISDSEISSPYIAWADSLIIMNNPSLIKFKDRFNSKGLLLINNSLVDIHSLTQINANLTRMVADKKSACICVQSARICVFPFTDIAIKLGNLKVANMVALGCYLAQKKIINPKTVFKVIAEIAPQDKKGLMEINQQALTCGMRLKDGSGKICA